MRRILTSFDTIAIAEEAFRLAEQRGSPEALTAADHESIEAAGTPKDFHNFATLKERVIALEAENRRLQRALREAAPSQYPDPAYRPPGLWVVS